MASVLEAFGAQPLLHGMATITNHGGDSNSPLPKRMEDHQLQCAASGIRLLVTLLRESHIACSPRSATLMFLPICRCRQSSHASSGICLFQGKA